MRFIHLLTSFVLLYAVAIPALAQSASGVRDDAKFFSPEAINEAEQAIRDITSQFKKEVLIETFPTIPEDRKASYDPANKDAFFSNWATERARAAGVNGVYVLINKDPSYLRVSVGNETRRQLFTLDDAKAMRDAMLAPFKEKRFDQGLLDGVHFVQQRMQQNRGNAVDRDGAAAGASRDSSFPGDSGGGARTGSSQRPAPVPAPAPGPGSAPTFGLGTCLIPLLVVVGIIWLLSKLMRRGTPSGPGAAPGMYPGPGAGYGQSGGGGFGRGLLGGLLGGAAGSWLSNRTRGPGVGGGAYPPDNTGGGAGGSFDSPRDSDFNSGAGGDFGDAGGSSFGDSGGGGGFDSGGGGSDSSGSGGSF